MPGLQTAFLSLLFASSALAAPKHGHHHKFHSTGTGGSKSTTGLYGYGNSTAVGPTGTGTAPVVYSTVLVNPLPASTGGEFLQVSTSDECGAATVTVTAASTVTLTTTFLTSTATVLSTVEPYSNGTSSVAPFAPSGTAPSVYSSGEYHHKWTSVMVSPSAISSVDTVAVSSTEAVSSTLAYTSTEFSSSAAISSTVGLATSTEVALSTTEAEIPTTVSSEVALSSTDAAAPTSASSVIAASSTAAAIPASSAGSAETTSPAVSTRSGNGLSGGKRGVVYNTASLLAPIASASNSPISWAYNWDSKSSGLPSGIKFVPQLWGLTSDHTSGWKTNAAAAIKSGADSLMAYNEPDMPSKWGGSQIDPRTAASNYITYMNPFAGQVQLGAPAVSNANSSSPLYGIQWLEQFFTACNKKCSISNVPFHWYGWAGGSAEAQAAAFKQYVGDFTSQVTALTGIANFWITEFSALPLTDPNINAQFLNIVLPWLDSQAHQISRYSFFMVSNGLLVSGGSLTASGTAYANDH